MQPRPPLLRLEQAMKPFASSLFSARLTVLQLTSQSAASVATAGHTTGRPMLVYSLSSTAIRYSTAVTRRGAGRDESRRGEIVGTHALTASRRIAARWMNKCRWQSPAARLSGWHISRPHCWQRDQARSGRPRLCADVAVSSVAAPRTSRRLRGFGGRRSLCGAFTRMLVRRSRFRGAHRGIENAVMAGEFAIEANIVGGNHANVAAPVLEKHQCARSDATYGVVKCPAPQRLVVRVKAVAESNALVRAATDLARGEQRPGMTCFMCRAVTVPRGGTASFSRFHG